MTYLNSNSISFYIKNSNFWITICSCFEFNFFTFNIKRVNYPFKIIVDPLLIVFIICPFLNFKPPNSIYSFSKISVTTIPRDNMSKIDVIYFRTMTISSS